MFVRIFTAISIAVLLEACAGTPSTASLLGNSGHVAAQAGLRHRMDWNRKCAIMVLSSNEPEKAYHLASRCDWPLR